MGGRGKNGAETRGRKKLKFEKKKACAKHDNGERRQEKGRKINRRRRQCKA